VDGLKDKVVLISGTAGGLGRAAALAFARAGAKVFGSDVKTAEAEETVALVTRAGGTMRSIQPLDLSDFENAKAWAKAAVDTWGSIDVLYNNAGSLSRASPVRRVHHRGMGSHAAVRADNALCLRARGVALSRGPRWRSDPEHSFDCRASRASASAVCGPRRLQGRARHGAILVG
jgi:NAD(P)-dependent dehydrogenase (short-subunit alcohol dehydrogenase family)